uniref:Uncharacterized protein n=1 Tax=Panagrolaimus sp. JU765 TaxID=591449 RepID=A0AC34QTX7_9BILA
MPERIQVSSNVELKDKVIDHGVDLLNMEQLSGSQKRELQRFIDSNSHLLQISDKEREEREKKEKKQNRYSGPGHARLNMSSPYSDYGSNRQLNTGSLNRFGSPYSEYGTGKRKEVSWSDGVRARSHSPTNDGYGNDASKRNANYDKQQDPYSSLDRSSRDSSRERSRSREPPHWNKPWLGSFGSKEDLSSSGKPWHSYLKERENSPAYSSLQRHPDDYNRYETRKYIVKELEKTRRDDTARFYGYGDRVGSGIELTPKRWHGGEVIRDPNFLKKSLKPRRLFYSPIGDGVVEADGVELKHGPKDMTPKRYVTHERMEERGSAGHGGVRLTETRWSEGDGNDSGKNGDYGGLPFDDLGDKQRMNDDGKNYPPYYDNGRPSGDDWPRSGRSSALSIGTDGFPRHGWTKTFITNPRELINQYANETNTNIFDLEDHTPKTVTTVTELLSGSVKDEPMI